jgi:iron-sulfur cluster assembly protein
MIQDLFNLTEAAAAELKRIAALENKPCRLRLAMRGGGCSGFTVHMDLTEVAPDPEMDLEFTIKEVHFIFDYKSATFFDGATLDFGGTLIDRKFRWEFRNSSGGCGCGKSFSF